MLYGKFNKNNENVGQYVVTRQLNDGKHLISVFIMTPEEIVNNISKFNTQFESWDIRPGRIVCALKSWYPKLELVHNPNTSLKGGEYYYQAKVSHIDAFNRVMKYSNK